MHATDIEKEHYQNAYFTPISKSPKFISIISFQIPMRNKIYYKAKKKFPVRLQLKQKKKLSRFQILIIINSFFPYPQNKQAKSSSIVKGRVEKRLTV